MDINEIRQYNREVQAYQSKASELLASKDYRQKELDKLCQELTTLTGRTVTPDTLEQVYTEMMSQFQQTLNTGKEIIERAKAEEQSLNMAGQTGAANSQTANGFAGMAGATMQTQPQMQTPNQGQMNTGFAQMNQGFPQFTGAGLPGVPPFGQYDAHGTVSQI